MLALGLAWLALLVVEYVWGLSPILQTIGFVIWAIFVVEFVLRFSLAPSKLIYLRQNWLTAVSLVVPALRLLRIGRALRFLRFTQATRGLRVVRVVAAINRGMTALGANMARRGVGYVLAITAVVVIGGAAGMYAFERDIGDPRGIHSFGAALWWTAMIITTMGSEYWPQTVEGRILCMFLATYAFAVFGYLTAALASYFVGRDSRETRAPARDPKSLEKLLHELTALRDQLRSSLERVRPASNDGSAISGDR